ncbi:alpha/beta fold hydrolase [Natrinema hispanicum]|uniref:alpha/beta fold hydrolase n=1 Tax=Natrinema hispanicum TaxID=392421 RepID=UPI001A92FE38|nr:alpha/beta hydrolase [Natrinema hispanicum]
MGFFQLPSIPEWTWSAADWRLLRWFIDTSNYDDTFTDDDLARYRDAWSRPGAFTGMLNWHRALLRGYREKPPTMVLWGAQDSYLDPEMAQLSIEHCTDSRLEVIEDATHWLHHEVPDRVNSFLLEFLNR